jgi:hypothetical protein
MCDMPVRESHPQRPGKLAKASLILLVSVAVMVLLDITGPMVLSSGHQIISGRLHDQLAVLAVLSVPLMLAFLAIGSVLGMMDWLAARKAARRPSRMTVVTTVLSLAFLFLGVILILTALIWLVGPTTSIPGL